MPWSEVDCTSRHFMRKSPHPSPTYSNIFSLVSDYLGRKYVRVNIFIVLEQVSLFIVQALTSDLSAIWAWPANVIRSFRHLPKSQVQIASYADALWVRHAIFLPHVCGGGRVRDEPKERLRRRLKYKGLFWCCPHFKRSDAILAVYTRHTHKQILLGLPIGV